LEYVIVPYDVVVNENFTQKVLVMHPFQVFQLWRDEEFARGFYFGSIADGSTLHACIEDS